MTDEIKNYKQDLITEFAQNVAAKGLFAYISESGEYGFFTDIGGKRVVDFQIDGGGIKLSGCYAASVGNGSGWPLEVFGYLTNLSVEELISILNTPAPRWANRNPIYTTVAEQLKEFGKSSGYTLFIPKSSQA